MDWGAFSLGFMVGSVVFDLLWRVTFRWSQKLIDTQRNYIATLRAHLGLEL